MSQPRGHESTHGRQAMGFPAELQSWTLQFEQQRGDCIAMLTHDARNRLFVILNYVEILRLGARERGLVSDQGILESLEANCLALHSLITSCLAVSQIRSLTCERASIDLNAVLSRVVRQYAPDAHQRRLCLEHSLQPTLPRVEGDTLALERVFANLIENALKFTPAPGRITVTSRQRADEVSVTVTDTGPGMSAEHVALLTGLDRWGSATAVPRGLGLRTVRALVTAQDGRVEVTRPRYSGTCVAVFLRTAVAGSEDRPRLASE